MKRADFKCKECNTLSEIMISKAQDFPPFIQCKNCHSHNTYRIYSDIIIDVAEGKVGNAKTNYEDSIVYHPSNYGRYKGKKIK